MKRQIAEHLAGPQPETDSDSWRPMTDEIGIVVTQDDSGVLRGRLFVQRDGVWYPVAVDGFQQLGPRIVPAG